MIRLGLIGHSRGDIDRLQEVVDRLVQRARVQRIFHLGARFSDVDQLFERERNRRAPQHAGDLFAIEEGLGARAPATASNGHELARLIQLFVRVPAPDDDHHQHPQVPRTALDLVARRLVLATHLKASFTPDDVWNGELFVFGRGPQEARQFGPKLFICPGPLVPAHPGQEAGLAVVELDGHEVAVNFFDHNLTRRRVDTFRLDRGVRFTAR